MPYTYNLLSIHNVQLLPKLYSMVDIHKHYAHIVGMNKLNFDFIKEGIWRHGGFWRDTVVKGCIAYGEQSLLGGNPWTLSHSRQRHWITVIGKCNLTTKGERSSWFMKKCKSNCNAHRLSLPLHFKIYLYLCVCFGIKKYF